MRLRTLSGFGGPSFSEPLFGEKRFGKPIRRKHTGKRFESLAFFILYACSSNPGRQFWFGESTSPKKISATKKNSADPILSKYFWQISELLIYFAVQFRRAY